MHTQPGIVTVPSSEILTNLQNGFKKKAQESDTLEWQKQASHPRRNLLTFYSSRGQNAIQIEKPWTPARMPSMILSQYGPTICKRRIHRWYVAGLTACASGAVGSDDSIMLMNGQLPTFPHVYTTPLLPQHIPNPISTPPTFSLFRAWSTQRLNS